MSHCTLLHENCHCKNQFFKTARGNRPSTVVGYQNETSRNESGFNYYAPVFRTVGGTVDANGTRLIDIQEIQLDDSLTMLEANLQILNKGAAKESLYWWIDKTTAGSVGYTDGTRGCWVIEGDLPIPPDPPVMLPEGCGIQIDCPASKLIKNAGEVADDEIVFMSRNEAGFNYVGNAYPSQLNIQDILLDDSLTMLEANLQILNKGAAKESLYWWIDKTTAGSVGYTDGTRGCWVIEGDLPIPPDPPVMLNPGAAVQIDCPASKTITVLAPVEL